MAEEIGGSVAHEPDTRMCFVPDNDYAKFIKENSDCRISAKAILGWVPAIF